MRGSKWICAALCAGAVLGIFANRETVMLNLAPQAALSRGVEVFIKDLELRLGENPLNGLLEELNRQGNEQYLLDVKQKLPNLEEIRWDVSITTQSGPVAIQAEGILETAQRKVDFLCYLDGEVAVLKSQELLNGNCYGITYDTFGQTLRRNTALSLYAGEEITGSWENSMERLGELFQKEPATIPKLSWTDLRRGVHALAALDFTVTEDQVYESGEIRKVRRLETKYTGAEVAKAVGAWGTQTPEWLQELLWDLQADPDSFVQSAFYLNSSRLSGLSARMVTSEYTWFLEGDFEEEPGGDMTFTLRSSGLDRDVNVNVRLSRINNQETVNVIWKTPDNSLSEAWECRWLHGSDQLQFTREKEGERGECSVRIRKTEQGVHLSSPDPDLLVRSFMDFEDCDFSETNLVICSGHEIQRPAYQDFSQWTMEDFFLIITNLGSLMMPGK